MKPRHSSAKLRALLFATMTLPFLATAADPIEVVGRGPHEKRFKRGNQKWVEMATGLNRVLADGQTYVDADPRIQVFQNGSLAQETQHQLITAHDSADEGGTVDILWPTGTRFRTRTSFLAYHSRKTGQSRIFAEMQSVQSQVAGAHTLWPDCFEGASCDLLVKNDRIGVECDVVIRAQLIAPQEVGFAADDDSIMLQVWHQLLEGSAPRVVRYTPVVETDPVKRATYATPDISDEHLDWGSFFIGSGRCFVIGNANDAQLGSIPVYKTTGQTPDEKVWLIEQTRYSEIAPLLATLPLADAGTRAEQMRYHASRKPLSQREFLVSIADNTSRRGELPRALGSSISASARSADGKSAVSQVSNLPPSPTSSLTLSSTLSIPASSRPQTPSESFASRLGKLGKKKSLVTAALDWNHRPGVIVDFVTLNAGTTNGYVFQSDTVYYISGALNLGGETRMEPAVCIKMAKTNNASLNVTGAGAKLTTLGTAYNPIFITSVDDNTVGGTLPGSDGVPSQSSYSPGLYFDYLSSGVLANVSHLRISYAGYAIHLRYGTNHVISHTKLISPGIAVYADHNDYKLRNVLIYDAGTAFYGGSIDTMRGEFLTLHKVNNLGYFSYPNLFFTNSLIIGVTNTFSWSGAENASASTPDGILGPQVGAGMHYLATDGPNPHRNAGTTNVNPDLLREIRQLTTYPPAFLTNAVLLDTVLSPRVQRDVDLPDRGWHASPADYLVRHLYVTNATLILTQGVVVATFGNTGIWLQDNSTLISHGSILRRNHIVTYKNVQELSIDLAGDSSSGIAVSPYNYGNAPPTARFRFTDFDGNPYHFYTSDSGWTFASLSIRDCEFNAGNANFSGPSTSSIALTNNLFHRVNLTFEHGHALTACNNLFRGGFHLLMKLDPNALWDFKNNSFDGSSAVEFAYETTNTHNAYINGATRLSPGTAPSDIVLGSFAYDVGPLSRWMQTTNSTLWNAGSVTNAALVGMWHWGTRTNATMLETNSTLDIGWHAPFSTLSGGIISLADADGDGRFDAVEEDLDGDGVFDSGTAETDWLNYDSILGVGAGPGLVVFTPLK